MNEETEDKKIIEYVRDFIKTCPHLSLIEKININNLSNKANNCSIEPTPSKTVLKSYIDGSRLKQFNFIIAFTFDYSEEIKMNIDNSGIFEDITNWLEEKTINEELPDIGVNKQMTLMEATTSGYLYAIAPGSKEARYQIQCHMEYEEEA